MRTVRLEELELAAERRVLDLGCGEGRHLHALGLCGTRLRLTGLDAGFESLRRARSGFGALGIGEKAAAMVCGDLLRLPFRGGVFDAVICSEVLEHIPDYRHALREIARVVKPGGRLAVSVPRRFPERLCWLASPAYRRTPGGHVRIFRARHLREDIERSGFSFSGRHWAHGLHTPYWWLRCLFGLEREGGLIDLYHRFLVWIETGAPRWARRLGAHLDPLMGKSVVFYFTRREAWE